MAIETREQARPFTKEEYEAWMAECAKIEYRIKAALHKGREAMWELAEQLHAFDERSGWRALGHDTIGEWLADPDITIKRTNYYRAVDAWRQLVVIRKVELPTLGALDLTKVDIALPALKRGEAMLEDVISDVEVLGARDLRIKYGQQSDEPEVVPDGDVVSMDGDGDGELPVIGEVDVNSFQTVPRGLARTLWLVCDAILMGPGRPERKALSTQMRDTLIQAHALGMEFGLDRDDDV